MSLAYAGALPSLEDVRAERRARAARWRPRPYQLPLWDYLCAGGLRADVAAHRRWGKDDVALNWAARAAQQRIGAYWHLLPEASQARKAIWDAINPHTGKRRIDEAFPKETRAQTREVDMFIRFTNGSSWQVVGSDNYDSLVGAPPVGVVFSEWSLAKPEAWQYIRPILAENGGWAIFIWTPRGRNHATRALEAREQDANWFTQRSTALQTDVFSIEQLDRERQELIDECGSEEEGEAKFRQEYLVDFDAAVPGSYFGPQIKRATDEGRIGSFGHVPSLPVDTAWDIGVDDYTAIWFFQDNGKRVRVIDYFETSGEGAEAIVRGALPELIPDDHERAARLAELGRQPYRYRSHFLPHDVQVREWGAGAKSRRQTLNELGVKPIRVGVAQGPVERINAARRLMPVVSWDAKRCATGLDRLRNYRRRFNKAMQVFGEPMHDENSHGADAFGEYAVNSRIVAPLVKTDDAPVKDRWDATEDEGSADAWKTL
jgi:phage terminase large subunit